MKEISRNELGRLLRISHVRSRLQKELRYIPGDILDWEDRDFLIVQNRSKTEGVIVAPFEQMFAAPFQLTKRRAGASGRVEAIICDICATWQRGTQSTVMTFEAKYKSISYLVCSDLLCSFHVRDKTSAARISRIQLRETISIQERATRLRGRLRNIINHVIAE